MTLYREGTLLRDCLGDLWMITGYCRDDLFRRKPNAYVLQRLADLFISKTVYHIVHRQMELVSEA
jgi:hypothetical protein